MMRARGRESDDQSRVGLRHLAELSLATTTRQHSRTRPVSLRRISSQPRC